MTVLRKVPTKLPTKVCKMINPALWQCHGQKRRTIISRVLKIIIDPVGIQIHTWKLIVKNHHITILIQSQQKVPVHHRFHMLMLRDYTVVKPIRKKFMTFMVADVMEVSSASIVFAVKMMVIWNVNSIVVTIMKTRQMNTVLMIHKN